MSSPSQLAPFPCRITLPIQWGDQDAFGHVNNTIPIRWFESARIAYLAEAGMAHMMDGDGLGPILAAISCNYRRQLHHPDTVIVGARISRLGRTSMTMDHLAYSTAQNEVAVDGTSTIVVFDYQSQRPSPIPDALREQIEQFEKSATD